MKKRNTICMYLNNGEKILLIIDFSVLLMDLTKIDEKFRIFKNSTNDNIHCK